MENSKNINFSEDSGEDEENRQSINGSSTNIGRYLTNQDLSIGGQNLLWTNQTAVSTEPMRPERQPTDISSTDSTEKNGSVNNRRATDTGKMRQQEPSGQRQSQPAAISPADSFSRRNIRQVTTADPRARKKRNDKAYRDRVKEKQKRMESNLETLKVQNETLIKENTLMNQRFETQSKELDELNQKFIQQLENRHQMKFDLERLETENGELKREIISLKRDNALVNESFETQTEQLGKLEHEYKEQHERKRQLKSNLKTLEAENGRLKNEIIEFLKYERVAGSRTNFIGAFEQYPNEETEASPQVVPAIPYFGT